MQGDDPFVVVLPWRNRDDCHHVVEPLCCLRIGGSYGSTAVPDDGYDDDIYELVTLGAAGSWSVRLANRSVNSATAELSMRPLLH